jgi:hypothetical protein
MAKKGKLWSKIFQKKDDKDELIQDESEFDSTDDIVEHNLTEDDITGIELPIEPCHFCYEKLVVGDFAYKCSKCDVLYHYPDCIKNQKNCRSCGEKVMLSGNLAKIIKLRSVICPKCGMKIKLYFNHGPKLHISCPNCGHEGNLPNPYIKELKLPDFEGTDDDESIGEDSIQIDSEDDLEVWEEDELDSLEDKSDSDLEVDIEVPEEGPKIIKDDTHKFRKPKLVTLDRTVSCNICIEDIVMDSPVVVCKCGDKYHESCATEVGACPTCDGSMEEIINMIDDDQNYTPETPPELALQYEDKNEVRLDIGTELDTTLTRS